MPRATINENLASSGRAELFDTLKMETGEFARLCIPDEEGAWWEYVHSMRAPKLDDEDAPILEDKKRRDGSSAGTGYFMGFVGQRICLGDPAVIEDKKLDPDRCPACDSAKRGTAGMAPERRFAIPVIRYKCKKRSNTDLPATPGGDILVWKLNQKMYNELVKDNKKAVRELLEIPEGQQFPLRLADIVLYCENGDFSRIVFKSPLRPAWRDPKYAQLVKELVDDRSVWPTDQQLKDACGRSGDRAYMVIDVEAVEDRWRKAERWGKDGTRKPDSGDGPVSGGSQPSPDLDKDLTDMLAEHPGGLDEFAPRAGAKPEADPFGDPFAADAVPAPAAARTEADPFGDPVPVPAGDPVPVPAAAGKAASQTQSFDDLMKSAE